MKGLFNCSDAWNRIKRETRSFSARNSLESTRYRAQIAASYMDFLSLYIMGTDSVLSLF